MHPTSIAMKNTVRRSAIAALLCAAAPAFATPPPVSFAAHVDYANGGSGAGGWSETTLISADFNNDGKLDVINTDYFSQGAPILQLGLGNGAFQSPGTRLPAAANGVGALGAGDFNGDGKVDLLLSNTQNILVFLGNGDGSFTPGASYAIYTGGQEDIVVLDVNNDGKKDAVTITRNGYQVMLGNGNGTFTLPAAATVSGVFPAGIDDARFNTDGNADLVLIDGGGQAIPLLGHGDGSFTVGSAGYAGFILGTGLAGDFNHDGIDDVVALPEFNSGVRNAVVFISNGQGGFVNPTGTYYDGGVAPVSGEIADLNHDGNPDIISGDTGGGQAVILLGNGDGTFSQGGAFALSASVQTPVVGDFNADGKIDIAGVGISGMSTAVLSVLLNTTP